MLTDILRGELERLFELDELTALSRDVLGFEPSEVGGTLAKGSFAHALTSHCIQHDAVEALCDVLLATKDDVDPRIHELRGAGMLESPWLEPGESIGPFRVARPLGKGPVGTVYLARTGEHDVRVKLIHPAAATDRRGVHRFLTLNRLMTRLAHPGLPRNIETGRSGDAS